MVRQGAGHCLWGLLLLLASASLRAEVITRVDRTELTLGETLALEVIVRGHREPLSLAPLLRDFELVNRPKRRKVHAGQVREEWQILLAPKYAGQLFIPALSAGDLRSVPIALRVHGRGGEAPTEGPGQDYQLLIRADKLQAYLQEQIQLHIKVLQKRNLSNWSFQPPESADWRLSPLGQAEQSTERIGGQWYFVSEMRYVAFAQKSGALRLPPAQLVARLPGAGGQPGQTIRLTSNTLTFQIQEQAADYPSDAWWLVAESVQLQESWQAPARLQPGVPIQREIILTVDGASAEQLPSLEPPVIAGGRIYVEQDETQEQQREGGVQATRTMRWSVVPEQGGDLDIPALLVPWWRASAQRLERAQLPARQWPIEGPAAVPEPDAGERTVAANAGQAPYHAPMIGRPALMVGVALLLLLSWWCLRGRPAEERAVKPRSGFTSRSASVDTQAAVAPRVAYNIRHLKRACLNGEWPKVEQQLLAWGVQQWPKDPPLHLNDLARQVDDVAFLMLCQQLDRKSYSSDSPVLKTEQAWASCQRVIKQVKKTRGHKRRANDQDGLAEL